MITLEQAAQLHEGCRIWMMDRNTHHHWAHSFTVNRIQVYKRTPRIKVFLIRAGNVIIEQGVDNWCYTYNPFRVPQPIGIYSYRG